MAVTKDTVPIFAMLSGCRMLTNFSHLKKQSVKIDRETMFYSMLSTTTHIVSGCYAAVYGTLKISTKEPDPNPCLSSLADETRTRCTPYNILEHSKDMRRDKRYVPQDGYHPDRLQSVIHSWNIQNKQGRAPNYRDRA